MVGCHYDLWRVVVVEVGLEHFSLGFWYQVISVSSDDLAHVPDHSILSESTDDELFESFFAFIKLCGKEFEIFYFIFLKIVQSNFQSDRSWPVLKGNLLVEERFIKTVLCWNQSEVGPEGSKDPFAIFGGIKMDDWLSCWSELVVGIFADLFIEANLSIFRASSKAAFSGWANCSELRFTWVLLHVSNSFLDSGINLVNSIIWDSLEGLELTSIC